MKTAIYTEDGLVQLVMTPESEFEKNSMSMFRDKSIDAKLFEGSFYDCRGGWVMQSAYRSQRSRFDIDDNHRDQSLILVARKAEPTPTPAEMRGVWLHSTTDASIKDLNAASELNLAALRGEDTTGLCTVREWAESTVGNHLESWHPPSHPRNNPRSEMTFVHNGKRYSVEMVVTKVEDAK